MNIFDRQKHIANRIRTAEIAGATEPELAMYESALQELCAVVKFLGTEIEATEPVFINKGDGVPTGYIPLKNTSGMDFRKLSFEIDVEKDEKVLKTFTVDTVDWKNGQTARFYFNEDLGDGKELIVGAGAVSYERAYPRSH